MPPTHKFWLQSPNGRLFRFVSLQKETQRPNSSSSSRIEISCRHRYRRRWSCSFVMYLVVAMINYYFFAGFHLLFLCCFFFGKLHKSTLSIKSITILYLIFKTFQYHTASKNFLQFHTFSQFSFNSFVKYWRGLRQSLLYIKKYIY